MKRLLMLAALYLPFEFDFNKDGVIDLVDHARLLEVYAEPPFEQYGLEMIQWYQNYFNEPTNCIDNLAFVSLNNYIVHTDNANIYFEFNFADYIDPYEYGCMGANAVSLQAWINNRSIVIRYDEIKWWDKILIRRGYGFLPENPELHSSGWGDLLGSVDFVHDNNRISFYIPHEMLELQGNDNYIIETYHYGRLQQLFEGSFNML